MEYFGNQITKTLQHSKVKLGLNLPQALDYAVKCSCQQINKGIHDEALTWFWWPVFLSSDWLSSRVKRTGPKQANYCHAREKAVN